MAHREEGLADSPSVPGERVAVRKTRSATLTAASSFTPGPWQSVGNSFYIGGDGKPHPYAGVCVIDANKKSICAFPSNSKRDPLERDANIRLIAAAPELLEALKAVERDEKEFRCSSAKTLALVDAALSKATGEAK